MNFEPFGCDLIFQQPLTILSATFGKSLLEQNCRFFQGLLKILLIPYNLRVLFLIIVLLLHESVAYSYLESTQIPTDTHAVFHRINMPGAEAENEPLSLFDFNEIHNVGPLSTLILSAENMTYRKGRYKRPGRLFGTLQGGGGGGRLLRPFICWVDMCAFQAVTVSQGDSNLGHI